MTSTTPRTGSSLPDDDRFLDLLGRKGRIDLSGAPADPQRLREGFTRGLVAARRSRRRAGWLAVAAVGLLGVSMALEPRGGAPVAASAADAEDDLLLRQARACRQAPALAGLRSAFASELPSATSVDDERTDHQAAPAAGRDAGARS